MADDQDLIHKVVQERYGAIAARSGCCGPVPEACDCSPSLYDQGMLEGFPEDVTGISLGCGDPVTLAGLRAGEVVLDLGSGGGIDCFLAARQVGEAGYVIGVDMTPEMVAKAELNKAKLGATNVEFREGEIESLPVDDESVDVVMSNCVINLSPDKPAVFREAFRALRPGGRISISDVVTEGSFSEEERRDLESWAACVAGAADIGEYTRMMREAGFVEIQVVDRVPADGLVERSPGAPRVFSARLTGIKPGRESRSGHRAGGRA